MTTIVKLALLALSLTGYAALFHKRRLPAYYFPAVLICSVSVTLYAFGMVGFLQAGAYAVLAGGIFALLYCRGFRGWRDFLSDGSILFAAFAACWLFVITRGTMLSHWDDGSHWYRIVKALSYEHAFPTTPDIFYNEYVPGCQLFIYFLMRFMDFTIPNCLFAQNLINIACVTTLFAALEGVKERLHRAMGIVVIGVSGIVLCSMTVTTYVLLVDLPLGLVAMAALIFALDQGKKSEGFLPLVLMLTFLALIKNSGLLFVVMVTVWACAANRSRGKALAVRAVCFVGIPAAAMAAYIARAKVVYAAAEATQQKLSLERMLDLMAQKDAGTMKAFTANFLNCLFVGDSDISLTVYTTVLLMGIFLILVSGEGRRDEFEKIRNTLLGGLAMLGVYAASLYATYLLTMTPGEALTVNSFHRYFGTGVIVFIGVNLFCALRCAVRSKASVRMYIMGMLFFAVFSMQGVCSKRYIVGQSHYTPVAVYYDSLWREMEIVIPENRYYTPERYAVLFSQNGFADQYMHAGRVEYAVGAWVRSDKVTAISDVDLANGLTQEQIDALQAADKLIILSDMSLQANVIRPYIEMERYLRGTYNLESGKAETIWQPPQYEYIKEQG